MVLSAAVERGPSEGRVPGAQDRRGCAFHLFHRGGSASKKGTWPLPLHPSQAARCASTGIFNPLLSTP